ncbi:MAG: oligosaccharide flippase family protein [Lentimicrobium sp.]
MVGIGNILKNGIKNPAIIYIVTRYGTYIIQFINTLFIAIYLGPYYLGIWGFINLVLEYIRHLNFGISHSVNVIISIRKQDEVYIKKIIGNGIGMTLCLSLMIIIFFMINRMGLIMIGNKYNFNQFIIPISIIAVLTHFNSLLSTIFRVFGKIHAIAINQSLYPLMVLFVIPFFREDRLLWAMLITLCVAYIISFILFLVKTPVRVKPLFEARNMKLIQIKGWHLFIYNTSLYLIILSTKSFISGNYSVSEFGYFTFSYSLATAVLLLLDSLSYLIFPKTINRFANLANEQISHIMSSLRVAYISISHFLIHSIIMIFPLFLKFFPAYSESSSVFKITALAIVLYTNAYGYQSLLIAKGKEKLIGFIAFCALILNIALSALLVFIVNVTFEYVILSTLLTHLIYVTFIGLLGRKTLKAPTDFLSTINDIFPWRMMTPFLFSLFFVFIKAPESFFVIPFILYLIMNIKDILGVKKIILKVISNPNFINI